MEREETSARFGAASADEEQQGVIGMGELLSASPKIEWLIEGVLPTKGRSMLYAAEKVGKSFVVLDMALHVATGRKWQRLPVKQGSVYYVASENAETFNERVQAWQRLHGGLTPKTPFYVVPRAYNLLKEAEVTELLGKLGPARLVIIDTLGRSMDGGDENGNNDLNRVATAMDQIREATGAAVLLVQHEGDTPGKPRGASAQRGMVQTMIRLTRKEKPGDDFSDGSEITLTCKAQTRAKKFADITLRVKLVKVARGMVVPAIARGKDSRATKQSRIAKDTPTSRNAPQKLDFDTAYALVGDDRDRLREITGKDAAYIRQRLRRMNQAKQAENDAA